MKPPVPFFWVDVFAESRFGGNPLAVLDGADLAEDLLLPLARELSLSETTFYYPPTVPEADARVRIFTLAQEVPFAGHPTLGTAVALLLSGRLPWRPPSTTVRLQLGIGVVEVTVSGESGPERARFRHSQIAVPGSEIRDERLAWLQPALGLIRGQLGARVPIEDGAAQRTIFPQVVSGGARQLMVPVSDARDIDVMSASYPDVVAAERALGAELGILAFAFMAPPPRSPEVPVRVRARFFAHDAPHEDPATGSAAASLAVYLHHHGILQPGQTLEIDQGPPHGITPEIPGRRSLLRAACDGTHVEVEGRVREVLRGELRLR
jgi:PhzF family phenazine biosynthesis protein